MVNGARLADIRSREREREREREMHLQDDYQKCKAREPHEALT